MVVFGWWRRRRAMAPSLPPDRQWPRVLAAQQAIALARSLTGLAGDVLLPREARAAALKSMLYLGADLRELLGAAEAQGVPEAAALRELRRELEAELRAGERALQQQGDGG
ncbi:MAG: hypothetical protein NTZ05_16420 [Chloroflexi bacterium]|nr:hypothetical protein [Chloroflexota bacterium]